MFNITLIPGFETNYFFVLTHKNFPGECVLVDPGDAAPVIAYLQQHALTPSAILVTHHHPDHVGGISKIVDRYGCDVYANDADKARIPRVTHTVKDGDTCTIFGETCRVMDVPGHTVGIIAFYLADSAALFCGDALFGMGCGRMFEGTAEQFHASLQRIAALPDETRVYCAHEYTVDNARFCVEYTEGNAHIACNERLEQAEILRSEGKPTVPLNLGEEKRTNPFLTAENHEAFAAIRRAKDRY